jgi:hypothetical protein
MHKSGAFGFATQALLNRQKKEGRSMASGLFSAQEEDVVKAINVE